jgi:hypothetical protein
MLQSALANTLEHLADKGLDDARGTGQYGRTGEQLGSPLCPLTCRPRGSNSHSAAGALLPSRPSGNMPPPTRPPADPGYSSYLNVASGRGLCLPAVWLNQTKQPLYDP